MSSDLIDPNEMQRRLTMMSRDDEIPSLIADTVMPITLSRLREVKDPTTTVETGNEGVMQSSVPVVHEARRLNAFTKTALPGFVNNYHKLSALERRFPDIANELGINDAYWDKFKSGLVGAGKRGWTAIEFLLNNLDRPRGAITAYVESMQKGGSKHDARRRALDVLRGSDKGFKWNPDPQNLGPTGKELLLNAGFDDSLSTSMVGFVGDVLFDPLILLGIGPARKAINVGADQFLNRAGREVYGEVFRKKVAEAGLSHTSEATGEALTTIHREVSREMREMLRDRGVAKDLLDIGGLKFALTDTTLWGSARIRKQKAYRRGAVEYDWVGESLLAGIGRKTGETTRSTRVNVAEWANDTTMPLPEKVRRFLQVAPDNIADAGDGIGEIFHRTNPAAGKEYVALKQAEYFDRIGHEHQKILKDLSERSAEFSPEDMSRMTYALDEGRLAELPPSHQKYVEDMTKLMDLALADEVERGIFRPEWSKAIMLGGANDAEIPLEFKKTSNRKLFTEYINDIHDPNVGEVAARAKLPAEILEQFDKVRVRNYVPHVYRNVRRFRKLFPADLKPRAPSITETHAFSRKFQRLREAEAARLVPETNLEKLVAYRLASAARANTTYDFLAETVQEFGTNVSAATAKGSKALTDAGRPLPTQLWRDLATRELTGSGMLPGTPDEHIQFALRMAGERGVPAKVIALLDDAAKSAFLTERLRRVKQGVPSARLWKKYVEKPTKDGLYDGFAVAPGKTLDSAILEARDLKDPMYGNWVPVTFAGRIDPAELKRAYLPAPIAADLGKLRGQIIPEEVRAIVKLYDTMNYTWKRNVTVIWPAFHVRNKVTNIINSLADVGMGVLLDRPRMWNIMWGNKGTMKTDVGGMTYTYDQVRELMVRHGVVKPTYRRNDIEEAIEDLVARRTKAKKTGRALRLPGGENRAGLQEISNPLFGPYAAGTDAALQIENADRAILFIKSLQRGLPPEQAAMRVNKFLFDYDDISRTERNWIRRAIPFYVWVRKNLALQTNLALTKPKHHADINKFVRNMSKEDGSSMRSDVERTLLPEYMHDHFGIRIETGQRISRYLLNLDLPGQDLNKLWDKSLKNTVAKQWFLQLSPYTQEVAELIMGKNFYTDKEFVKVGSDQRVGALVGSLREQWPWMADFLQVRKTVERDKITYRVNARKWQSLMVLMTLSGVGTRFYSAVATATADDQTGSAKLWRLLTGLSMPQVNAGEELRRRAESMIRGEKGMAQELSRTTRQFMDSILLKGSRRALQQSTSFTDRMKDAWDTPIDGWEIEENE